MLQIHNISNRIKNIVRRFLYPILNQLQNYYLKNLTKNWNLDIDLYSIGQRGNDYQRHRRKVNYYQNIKGKRILIAGCGSGKDVLSWAIYSPKEIIAVDLFEYSAEWQEVKRQVQDLALNVDIKFVVADLERLDKFQDQEFDFVVSDAVFEHIQNLPVVLSQLHRVLKQGGLLYAGFGPLWYTHGGDHVSGYDSLQNGFSHLIMDQDSYSKYLDGKGPYVHDEDDGRTWIKNNLFSYLKPHEYISHIQNAGFTKIYNRALLSEKALKLYKTNQLPAILRDNKIQDILIFGMIIIYSKNDQITF